LLHEAKGHSCSTPAPGSRNQSRIGFQPRGIRIPVAAAKGAAPQSAGPDTGRAQGLLTEGSDQTADRYSATLDFPAFRKAEIQRAFDWFEFPVHRGQRPLHSRLREVLRNEIYRHPRAHHLFTRLLPLWHAVRDRVPR
jgi:hypothetical protein